MFIKKTMILLIIYNNNGCIIKLKTIMYVHMLLKNSSLFRNLNYEGSRERVSVTPEGSAKR